MTAHLARRGVQVGSHQQREAALALPANGVTLQVYDAYLRLKRRSVGARYLLQTFTPAQVRHPILDNYLAAVTAFVRL